MPLQKQGTITNYFIIRQVHLLVKHLFYQSLLITAHLFSTHFNSDVYKIFSLIYRGGNAVLYYLKWWQLLFFSRTISTSSDETLLVKSSAPLSLYGAKQKGQQGTCYSYCFIWQVKNKLTQRVVWENAASTNFQKWKKCDNQSNLKPVKFWTSSSAKKHFNLEPVMQ